MKITCITAACHRPEAWQMSEAMMKRQTVQPDQWLVLDEDDPPTVCTMGQTHIYCPEVRDKVRLNEKLRIAFSPGVITGDIVVFWENDDWYAPTWLEQCIAGLANAHIFGEGKALYYNVAERWWFEHNNQDHCSLCSTAVRREAFDTVRAHLKQPNPFIDQAIWRSISSDKRKIVMPPRIDKPRLVVGIKAMPGRVGYSGAHTVRDKAARDDLNLSVLSGLLGEDAKLYEPFYRPTMKRPTLSIIPPKVELPKPLPPGPQPKVPFHTDTGRGHGPNWLRWLGHLIDKPGAVGLEIGTFRGDSAEFMCENVFTGEGTEYICVDPFTKEGSPEHVLHKIDCSENEAFARERLSAFKQCKIIKGFSQDVLNGWTGKKLDFVYVDGLHTAQAALRDAVLAFEALKVGGCLCWDDYLWDAVPRPIDRPKIGVDAFLAAYADQIELISPKAWQVAIRKTKE